VDGSRRVDSLPFVSDEAGAGTVWVMSTGCVGTQASEAQSILGINRNGLLPTSRLRVQPNRR